MDPNQYPKDRVVLCFLLCLLIAYIHIVILINQDTQHIVPGIQKPILIATSEIPNESIVVESTGIQMPDVFVKEQETTSYGKIITPNGEFDLIGIQISQERLHPRNNCPLRGYFYVQSHLFLYRYEPYSIFIA